MGIKILLIGAVVLMFVGDILLQKKSKQRKSELLQELNSLLAKEDYKAFDKLIESDEVKRRFPAYNLAYMKLNEAMLKNNPAEINKAFTGFNIRMNKSQRETILKRAFYYYLGIEDIKRAKHYYNLIKELKVKDQVTLDIMYDTYIDKGYRYLNEVLENYKKLPIDEQIPYITLIGDMYQNKNDEEKAKEYHDIANKVMEKLKEVE